MIKHKMVSVPAVTSRYFWNKMNLIPTHSIRWWWHYHQTWNWRW